MSEDGDRQFLLRDFFGGVDLWGTLSPCLGPMRGFRGQKASCGWSTVKVVENIIRILGKRRMPWRVLLLVLWWTFAVCPEAGRALTFSVDSILDLPDAVPGDGVCSAGTPAVCTLRAAIQEANSTPELDTVRVPSLAPRFRLTTHGSDNEDASRGDLDIVADLVVEGVGPGVATIDGDLADRIFDIYPPARVTVRNLVLQRGQVEAAGGAIRNASVLELEGVTFRDNAVSTGSGGALANLPGSRATVRNCTFFNNVAAPNGQGGAVANLPGAMLELESVTFSTNGAMAGGAVHNLGVGSIHNSIVAASTVGANCAGVPLVSRGYNLDSGTSCLFDQLGDLNNGEARLSGLAFNGGLSLTMALQAGSEAIDRGDPADCPLQDQRGFPRPADGNGDGFSVCDIGAFEVNPPTPTPTITRTPTPTVPSPTSSPTPTGTILPATPTSTPTLVATPSATPSSSPSGSPAATSPTPTPTVSTPTASETPALPVLEVATVAGIPGQRVPVTVRLRTGGYRVVAVQAEISFDPANAPIAPRQDGSPDCTPNGALNKSFEVGYRPVPCVGQECQRVAAYLFSQSLPLELIPDGVLWTCVVEVNPAASEGAYTLSITNEFVADEEGTRIVGVILSHGAVVVVAPTPTPMPTPTSTASPTPTVVSRCEGDCDGNGLVTIDELVTMVGVALELRSVTDCLAGDRDGNGLVTVDEIIAAVNRALLGCA